MFNNKDLDLYKGFYDWLGKPEMFKQGKNRKLEYADVAPLLYLKLALEDNKTMYGIKHLLVDEMQDYTPIQYKVLAKLFPLPENNIGRCKAISKSIQFHHLRTDPTCTGRLGSDEAL